VTSTTPLRTRLAIGVLGAIVRPTLNVLLRREWTGIDLLPKGPCIVCPNHLTEVDPFVIGHLLYSNGRIPRFLAKESLFRIPVLGRGLHWAGQIPVDRRGLAGMESLAMARRILREGGTIVIYPEGTLTHDPALWPMRARTGAARLALETRVPLVPMAHWGAQELVSPTRHFRPFPRKTVRVTIGAPVDLTELPGTTDRQTLENATARIQRAITDLLATLRQEPPPERLHDPSPRRAPA
jgi:1-acyl-sn-glycerol-3-phosphate acyltransferase